MSTLFDIIESADLSTGPGANVAKRALHALGEAECAPTPDTVARVGKVAQATRDAIDMYLQQLADGGTSFPALFDPALVRPVLTCCPRTSDVPADAVAACLDRSWVRTTMPYSAYGALVEPV